jgi:hypothetical protein
MILSAAFAVNAQTKPWTTYTSPEGRYSISLPAEPTVKTDEAQDAAGGKLVQYFATAVDGNAVFMVTYFSYNKDSSLSLEKARDGIVQSSSGTLESDEAINFAGSPGRAIKLAAKTTTGVDYIDRARIYDVNRNVYILQCIAPKGDDSAALVEKCDKFVNSFKLSKP